MRKINNYKKVIMIVVTIILSLFAFSCEKKVSECTHESCTWIWEDDAHCNQNNTMYYVCDKCKAIIDEKSEFKDHEYIEERTEATCIEAGYVTITCKNCKYNVKKPIAALGHDYKYVIDKEATESEYGIKHQECTRCGEKLDSIYYCLNDYSTHGALHVDGVNLKDKNNENFRLAGISTFGLQWQGEYVNYNTFEALKNYFGINVIRLSLYTAEGGYCVCDAKTKETLYNRVRDGINYATSLNMYVIVDWHMLGADEEYEEDENPLYFKEEAKEFFDKVTKEFSDHDNILFEIMNEPSGSATWADCKTYALEVIPVIRANMPNAIILVGNPQWTSDLVSVAKDPITGIDNIMYSFHFYAGDNCMTDKIVTAVKTKHLPVFVTEHGAMDADGYGTLDFTSLEKWYKVLDEYNISFVAWSLSNYNSSSCMIKTGCKTMDDFSDVNLKEWGIYYKKRVRKIMGLPYED